MPTYALLGATGATGSAVLRCLLSDKPSELKLNVFVRSKSKLLASFPQLQTTSPFPIDIFEGSITDKSALKSCLEDADVVFMCIATNDSAPGMSIALDTARAIVASLEVLREDQASTYKTPTILQNRSSSLNPNVNWGATAYIVHFCFYHVYADLKRAGDLYRSKAKETPDLLGYVFIDPPSLHDANGTERTGFKLLAPEQQKTEPYSTSLSYADLGAAFCEVAQRREEFAGQSAVVSATGKVNETWGTLVSYILRGARGRFFG